MNLHATRTGRALIVRLDGELDLHTVEPFKEAVADALAREPTLCHLILLMQQVTFMDSSGIGAILGRYRDIKERGGRVAVVGLQPAVRRIFELAGMNRVINHYSSEREALAKLAQEGSPRSAGERL